MNTTVVFTHIFTSISAETIQCLYMYFNHSSKTHLTSIFFQWISPSFHSNSSQTFQSSFTYPLSPLHLLSDQHLTLAEETRTPRRASSPVVASSCTSISPTTVVKAMVPLPPLVPPLRSRGASCRWNMGREGQNRSEKWCSSTKRFRSDAMHKLCRWFSSMGIAVGSRPALTGLWVDQARLWAEPHATRLIFLPVIGNSRNIYLLLYVQ